MLSVSDLETRARLGDETVATTPDDDQPDAPNPNPQPFNNLSKPHVQQPVEVGTIAAGGTATVQLPYEPDVWIVTLPSTANVVLEISTGPAPTTPPVARIEPNQGAKIFGKGPALSIRNTGSAAGAPNVVGISAPGGPTLADFDAIR